MKRRKFMASCLNNVKLIGYVCTSVEQIDSDPIGVRFKLVTNETFFSKKSQEYVKNSEAHLVKSWKQSGTFSLNNVNVGDYLYIEGKLHYHVITTDDGRKIRNPEVIASRVIKLNRRAEKNVQDEDEGEDPAEKVETEYQAA